MEEISFAVNCGNNIVVADKGNKIYLFDSGTGQFISELQNAFTEIRGLLTDSRNNIYVLNENDILFLNSQGAKTGAFSELGIKFFSAGCFNEYITG